MEITKKKVLVSFVQDRSGSMANVWSETLNGFKSFVNELKDNAEKDGVDYLFSLTVFDTTVETPIVAQPIDKVDLSELAKHGPRGSTALYDATGKSIKAIEDNRHGAEKIIVVIVTDGHENSSREWTKDGLHASIDAKLNAGDWTFTYLGTQPETWDDAMSVGVGAGSAVNYSGAHANAAYTVTASAVRGISGSTLRNSRNVIQDFSSQIERSAASMCTATDNVNTTKRPVNAPTKSIPQRQLVKNAGHTPKSRTDRKWKK